MAFASWCTSAWQHRLPSSMSPAVGRCRLGPAEQRELPWSSWSSLRYFRCKIHRTLIWLAISYGVPQWSASGGWTTVSLHYSCHHHVWYAWTEDCRSISSPSYYQSPQRSKYCWADWNCWRILRVVSWRPSSWCLRILGSKSASLLAELGQSWPPWPWWRPFPPLILRWPGVACTAAPSLPYRHKL